MARNEKRAREATQRAAAKGKKITGAAIDRLYAQDAPTPPPLGTTPLERRIQRRTVSPPPRKD